MTGIGHAVNANQSRVAQKRTRGNMKLQQRLQKELNEQGMQIGKEMWDYTNFGNQMKHLKEAGLNPSLIYGGGGQGGSTSTPSGGGASGGGAPTPPYMEIGALGGQMALIEKEAKLMEAQAKKTEAEADKIAGVDTEKAGVEIASLLQGIENQKARKQLEEMQTKLTAIQADIATEGKTYTLEQMRQEMFKLSGEAESAIAQADIDSSTKLDRIEMVGEELISIMLENDLKRENINYTKEQIKATAASVLQRWEELDYKAEDLHIRDFAEHVKANNPSIMNALGGMINDARGTLDKLIGGQPVLRWLRGKSKKTDRK